MAHLAPPLHRTGAFAVTWADKYDLWQQDAEWETRTCPWQMVVTCRFSTPERYDLRVFSDERLHETYLRRYGRPMFAYEQQLRRRETGAVQPVILSFDGRSYRLLFLNSSLRDSQTLAAWHRRHPEINIDGYLVGQLVPPLRWKLSLYTANGSGINAARIAQRFGGGGHASAAGFTLSPTDFEKHIKTFQK